MPTVSVACKIENGLVLGVFKMTDVDEPVMGGGVRVAKRAEQVGSPVVINGPRRLPHMEDPLAFASDGFVLTHGVDEAFMAEWMAENRDHPAVVNGLIRVHAKAGELKAMTREARDQKTGMEPLSPAGDKRVPKNKGQVVEKFDGKAAA